TRLLAINDVVAQVTLTFRTSDDEELRHRYDRSPHLQQLILTTAISLVNCNYTSGMGRGPGFLIHQMRKKWPIGRRYIFTRHGDPLHSSMHKYFLQLEFTDEPADAMGEMVEIVEMRALGASPALSSYAGSMIDGLEAVELPEAEVLGYEAERHDSGHSGVTPAMRRASVADRPVQQQSPLMRARSVSRSSFGSVGQPSAAWDYQRPQYQPRTSPATRPISTGAVQQPVSAVSAASSATLGASVSPPGDGRLGRTAWYRSLHGISPLSRQPKSLSSEGEFFQPTSEGQGSQPAPPPPPRVAGAAPPVSRIPRPPASKPTAMASLASRLRRGVLAPLERRHAGRSAAEHPSSIPRPPSATAAQSEQSSMPPPPAATPRMQPRAHDSAVPSAVKHALLRRLRSPLGGFVDRAPSRASVRERIQAFDSLTVRGGTPEHEPARPSFSDTPSGRSPPDALPPTMGKRTRVPTDTGFISQASPGRPLSRPSSRPLSRPSSPANTAVSVRSNVSARVMDTIQALERSAAQVEQNTGRAEHLARGSGVKRQAEAPPDFVSPTKRTRDEAESLVADKSHASSNPFAAMNRLVRKHTRRF
ncbi:hypothetical protein GGI05_003486, partial [Coemansia sp. RSA 2603]